MCVCDQSHRLVQYSRSQFNSNVSYVMQAASEAAKQARGAGGVDGLPSEEEESESSSEEEEEELEDDTDKVRACGAQSLITHSQPISSSCCQAWEATKPPPVFSYHGSHRWVCCKSIDWYMLDRCLQLN